MRNRLRAQDHRAHHLLLLQIEEALIPFQVVFLLLELSPQPAHLAFMDANQLFQFCIFGLEQLLKAERLPFSLLSHCLIIALQPELKIRLRRLRGQNNRVDLGLKSKTSVSEFWGLGSKL